MEALVNMRSRRRSKVGLAALGAAAIAISGFYASDSLLNGRKSDPISVTNLSFGDVWAQNDFKWTVAVHNKTDEPLNIGDVSASCKCVSITPLEFSIPPNESADLSLSLNLGPRNAAQPLDSVESFGVAILLSESKSHRQLGPFRLKGTSRNAIAFSDSSIFFGEQDNCVPEFKIKSRTVSFTSAVPLSRVDVSSKPGGLLTSVARLDSPKHGSLEIAPQSGIEADRFDSEVLVRASAIDGQSIPPVTLPVSGVVLHDIYLQPALISFGPRIIGETADARVSLESRVGSRIRVQSTKTSDEIAVERIETPNPDGSIVFQIRQRISKPGQNDGKITFSVESNDSSVRAISLPVIYVGLVESQANGR